jgi:hypothetical protein
MAGVALPDLAGPERLLWAAFPRGEWVDLREGDPLADDLGNAHCWGQQREIRAEVIRALLLGACAAEPGHAPAVRLRGARILGRLDLMGAAAASALVCEYCYFESEIRLVEASTRTVRIVDSRFPGLNGTRLRVDGILNLRGCAVDGVLRLDQANVTGQVCVRGTTIVPGSGGVAFSADGLTVQGDLDGAGLTVRGSLRMSDARISGSADLSDARIFCAGARALTLSHAVIGAKLTGQALQVDGETRLHNARISGNIQLPGAALRNPGGVALTGGGLDVSGGMFCGDGFTAEGEINLIGARLGDIFAAPGARLGNPAGTALNLDRATMRDCDLADLACSGLIGLIGARIASRLSLDRAQLDAGVHGKALAVDGATVGGSAVLTGLCARGEVSMRTASVGEGIMLAGARLDNPAGVALCLDGAAVAADIVADSLTVSGEMRLSGIKVEGQLSLDQVRLANPGGAALTASGLRASVVTLSPAAPVLELVDLGHAQVDILRDNPQIWPEWLNLNGLTYRVLEPRLRAHDRLRWLARDPARHEPQPYEQLAATYSAAGQPAEARRVLYCRERQQRATKTPLGRTWGLIQDITVAYGYQPWRALLWLTLLLTAGSIVYAIAPPPALQPHAAPHFIPVIYTLDLLIPVVDFGQRNAFNPVGAEQWLSYFFIASGWLLATTVATGIARVINRQ